MEKGEPRGAAPANIRNNINRFVFYKLRIKICVRLMVSYGPFSITDGVLDSL